MERLHPVDLLSKTAKAIGHLLGGTHVLATHGDHEFNHFVPFEPEVTQPPLWDSKGYPHYLDSSYGEVL